MKVSFYPDGSNPSFAHGSLKPFRFADDKPLWVSKYPSLCGSNVWFESGGLQNIENLPSDSFGIVKNGNFDDCGKLNFLYSSKVHGRIPKRVKPIKIAKDKRSHWQSVRKLLREMPRPILQYFGDKDAFEKLFKTGKLHDPETLSDSDIEALAFDDNTNDELSKKSKGNEVSFNEKIDLEFEKKQLIIGSSSFNLAGESFVRNLKDGIEDIEVFNISNKSNDIILITQNTGSMYSIIHEAKTDTSIILQHWDLGTVGKWKIVKSQQNNNFVVVNYEEGSCKFFKFSNSLYFELVNSLNLEKTTILNCKFLYTQKEDDFLLFLPTIHYDRLVYFCIEWDNDTEHNKSVHPLTYCNQESFTDAVPIGLKSALVFTNNGISLKSAIQLMSGNPNSLIHKYRCLKGLVSSFRAPLLLKKLKIMDNVKFENFIDCVVLSSITGNIAIVLIDESERLSFFALTRFKGLKDIAPIELQPEHDNSYNLLVISFGRTVQLSIDLEKIYDLDTKRNISPLHGIIFKHTIDSASDDNSNIMAINGGRLSLDFPSDIWLTSPNSITELSPLGKIKKTYVLGELEQFQIFTKLNTYHFTTLSKRLIDFIADRSKIDDLTNDSLNSRYLVFGNDSLISSGLYILEVDFDKLELIKIENCLCLKELKILGVLFLENKMIQITPSALYIHNLELTCEYEEIRFEEPISGYTNYKEKLIFWNENMFVAYISNVNMDINQNSLKVSPLIKPMWKECNPSDTISEILNYDIKIIVEESGEVNVALFTDEKSLIFHWKDLIDQKWDKHNFDNETLFPVIFFNGGISLDYPITDDEREDMRLRFIKMLDYEKDCNYVRYGTHDRIKFSSNKLSYIKNFDNDKVKREFQFNLPPTLKKNNIIDVSADLKNNVLFVLYSDRLRVLDISYSTENRTNYLLKSTRAINKRFLFLKKLNRMLVLNLDNLDWQCIKPSDGKMVALDPTPLHAISDQVLKDFVEIYTENEHITLLLIYEHSIQLVSIIPKNGRLVTTTLNIFHFDKEIHQKVVPKADQTFFVIKCGNTTFNTTKNNNDALCLLKVENSKIVEIDSFEFDGGSGIAIFDICGDNLIVKAKKYDYIYVFESFKKLLLKKKVNANILTLPVDCKISHIRSLTDDCFVIVSVPQGRTKYKSELFFFDRREVEEFLIANSKILDHNIDPINEKDTLFDNILNTFQIDDELNEPYLDDDNALGHMGPGVDDVTQRELGQPFISDVVDMTDYEDEVTDYESIRIQNMEPPPTVDLEINRRIFDNRPNFDDNDDEYFENSDDYFEEDDEYYEHDDDIDYGFRPAYINPLDGIDTFELVDGHMLYHGNTGIQRNGFPAYHEGMEIEADESEQDRQVYDDDIDEEMESIPKEESQEFLTGEFDELNEFDDDYAMSKSYNHNFDYYAKKKIENLEMLKPYFIGAKPYRKPYDFLKVDGIVKELDYNSKTGVLSLLLEDQSILFFDKNNPNKIANCGYKILRQKPFLDAGKITQSGPWVINSEGLVEKATLLE